MKTARILIATLVMVVVSASAASAQSWLEKLGQKAVDRAEERAKQKVEDKVNKAVDNTVDGAFGVVEGTVSGDGQQAPAATQVQAAAPAAPVQEAPVAAPKESLEMTYAKSDFVPGDEIIFEDDLAGEQLGEFPSQWDLLAGNAEVAQIGGVNAIYFAEGGTRIIPLMENPKSYLPDVYTIEMDVYVSDSDRSVEPRTYSRYLFEFYDDDSNSADSEWDLYDFGEEANYSFKRPGGDSDINGGQDTKALIKLNDWNHIAFSFNKRAFKAYVNGTRVTNIPNTVHHKWISLYRHNYSHHTRCYIRNVRIAKGAVPLYDRMMSDGKFITYGITFDVGKSTIKPESMGEINRIVQLMNENPTLSFSVEGHTDSTGNAAANQTLSEARSKAIVARLTELGISADRLTASGKGQNNPIADNSTDEGRAKNRRVEFVKL